MSAHRSSWLSRGLEFAEGLSGLGEGVGDDLVPVHARAAGAQCPGALFASAVATVEVIS